MTTVQRVGADGVTVRALFLKLLRIGSQCTCEPPHDKVSTICSSSWGCGRIAAGPGLIETAAVIMEVL